MGEIIYFNSELDINGSSEQLFKQVRNGYFDNSIEAMNKIADIESGEGYEHRANYILNNILWVSEKDNAIANNFYRFLMEIEEYKDNPHAYMGNQREISMEELETKESEDSMYMQVNAIYNTHDDAVCIIINAGTQDRLHNSMIYPYHMIEHKSASDFEKCINELLYYADPV